MDFNQLIYTIAQSAPGFLFAVVIHEWAHGYMAKRFGDPTAERAGRLTLNPSAHIDPIGTILFPLIGVAIGGIAFGWAKPVPIDERNFSSRRAGLFWVSAAGALANFITGIVSAFFFVLSVKHFPEYGFKEPVEGMLKFSLIINFVLMGFNLIPLPPLDGSKMVSAFLKGETLRKYEDLARFTPMIFIAAILLSFNGVHTFSYILQPFLIAASVIMQIFHVIL